jgi:hypothetical protein
LKNCLSSTVFSICLQPLFLENAMLSNKKNFSSANNIFFQSRHPAWLQNMEHAIKKITELNTAAALAVAAESSNVARQYMLADSPQALLALASTQAQANLAKAQSYARHLSAIVFGIGGGELAGMKIALRKLSTLVDTAEKKLPAMAGPAFTLSDSANMAPGSDVSGFKLGTFDVADMTNFTDFTEIGDPIAGPHDGAFGSAPGTRHA